MYVLYNTASGVQSALKFISLFTMKIKTFRDVTNDLRAFVLETKIDAAFFAAPNAVGVKSFFLVL